MALDTIIHAVVKAFNDGRRPPIASFIGEKYIAHNDTPPRLVWVPTSDSFGPPVQVGANPKSYATRVAGVDCTVWGEDLAKTDAMVNDLIVALHRECVSRGNYELRGAEWVTAGELTNNGIVYLLRLASGIPIVGPSATPVRPKTETRDVDRPPDPAVTPPMPKQPVEKWAEQKRLPPWQFAAAKAHESWPQGFEVTEEEFDQAVQAACAVPLR